MARLNWTIREATVKRFHYDSYKQLRTRLNDFMVAYNWGRKLNTSSSLTPYEYVYKMCTSEPKRFIINPNLLNTGLNTYVFIGCTLNILFCSLYLFEDASDMRFYYKNYMLLRKA